MIIQFKSLTYSYPTNNQPALLDIDWSIKAGQFVLVAGPSAAGKSTLVRAINGLVPHFTGGRIKGHIEVAGQDVLESGPTVMSRYAGFVFQNPEAQMVLESVEEEIAFSMENAALPPAEIEQRIGEVLELLNMQQFRHRSLAQLSSGERQRVAIATSLARRPPILILDEPTSQLDPESARKIMEALADLNQRLGITIILTEHRLDRVVHYCDRFTYLEAGRIISDGPTRDVLGESPLAQQPPLSRLSNKMGWEKMPLTTLEARSFVSIPLSISSEDAEGTNGYGATKPTSGRLALQTRALAFSYADRPVLKNVEFSLAYGEAVAIIGLNGSGKSTLLKCLVGLLRPNDGDILLDGESIASLSVAKICRRVAYLPQVPDDLLFADTVREEFEATLNNHNITGDKQESLTLKLLEDLDLSGNSGAYPRDLSVGQRQRVALGAVSVTRPKVLLLDEPTRGLDYAAKSKLTTIWKKWQNKGMALAIVTHDIELAARVADRVVILNDGHIQSEGSVKSIIGQDDIFGSQISRLYPGRRWITVQDVIEGLKTGDTLSSPG